MSSRPRVTVTVRWVWAKNNMSIQSGWSPGTRENLQRRETSTLSRYQGARCVSAQYTKTHKRTSAAAFGDEVILWTWGTERNVGQHHNPEALLFHKTINRGTEANLGEIIKVDVFWKHFYSFWEAPVKDMTDLFTWTRLWGECSRSVARYTISVSNQRATDSCEKKQPLFNRLWPCLNLSDEVFYCVFADWHMLAC